MLTFWVDICSWLFKLLYVVDYEFDVWSRSVSKSLKFEVGVGVEVWSWILKLKSKFDPKVWAFNLMHTVKDWSLTFGVLFCSNQLKKWQ